VWFSKRRPVALDAGDTGDSEPAAQITA
jgi:hypothetical protein